MVNLDITIVIQFVNLCITLLFLHFFIIKPIRENISLRNEEKNLFSQELQALLDTAEKKMQEHQEKVSALQESFYVKRIEMSLKAQEEAAQIIAKAQREKEDQIKKVTSSLHSSFEAANKELLAKKQYFVDCIVQKII